MGAYEGSCMCDDPGVSDIPPMAARATADKAAFNDIADQMGALTQEMKSLSTSAEKMTGLVGLTLSALSSAAAKAAKRSELSYSKNKFLLAMSRAILSTEIEMVKA